MDYEREGNGPAIILLPGLGCDGRMWRSVGRKLSDRFSVIYPETWNHGSLPAAASAVGELMEELGFEGAGIAGLSMGGYVLFECLRHCPEKVRAAALLDTTPLPDDPARIAARQVLVQLIREGRFDEALESFVASVLPSPDPNDSRIRDLMRDMGRGLGPDVFAACLEAILKRGSYEDVPPLIRVPALFICGERDELTPPELAYQMAAEVPGARVVVMPGAGHMTTLETPDRVAQALGSFFDETLGQPTH